MPFGPDSPVRTIATNVSVAPAPENKHFGAVNHIVVAIEYSLGPQRRCIGARPRLSQAVTGKLFARNEVGDITAQ